MKLTAGDPVGQREMVDRIRDGKNCFQAIIDALIDKP